MSVRSLGLAFAVAVLLAPHLATAQRPAKIPKVGSVWPSPPTNFSIYRAFIDGMREQGYVEGRDFTMEIRSMDGKGGAVATLF